MIVTTSERVADDYGEGEQYNIRVESSSDKEVKVIEMSFGHGEPEDNYLFRDLSDAFNIVPAIKAAYEAGKRGEELVIKQEEVED